MLGNGKGVVAVVISVLWFQNPVSLYGLAGYGVTVSGVIAYSQARFFWVPSLGIFLSCSPSNGVVALQRQALRHWLAPPDH